MKNIKHMTIRINLYFIIMCCGIVSTVRADDECKEDTNSVEDDKCTGFINSTLDSAALFNTHQKLNFTLYLDNSNFLKNICYKINESNSWILVNKNYFHKKNQEYINLIIDIAKQHPANITLKFILKNNTCKLQKISKPYSYRPSVIDQNPEQPIISLIEASDTTGLCKIISQSKPTVTLTVKNNEGESVKDEKIEVSSDNELFVYYFNFNFTYINTPGKYYDYIFTVANKNGTVKYNFRKISSSHQTSPVSNNSSSDTSTEKACSDTSTKNASSDTSTGKASEGYNWLHTPAVNIAFGALIAFFVLMIIKFCCKRSKYYNYLSNLSRDESPRSSTDVSTSRDELQEYTIDKHQNLQEC